MPATHFLRCLGSPVLYDETGEPVRFRVRKHLALLAYLAVEARPIRRDQLAELLWPAAPEREGRHSLATALSVLRGKLGPAAVNAGRDVARLMPGHVRVDLDYLVRGEVLSPDAAPLLEVAPFLADFDVPDAPGWNHWRDTTAAHWRPAIRSALLTLIDRSRRHGNSRVMDQLANALLAVDPLSEDGIRAKMEACAFAGDRMSALRLYESWKIRLADEVGAQPGDLVEGMAVRLRRRGWERSTKDHIAPVLTDQWKDRPFVGRGPQYRAIYDAWEGTQRGRPRHAVITGDSGIGKSTLAERLATAAGLQGAVSAREHCHEVERDVPYATMGGLAAALLDKPGAATIAPEWLGELSRTVSEVRRRFPNAPAPTDAEGETARIRIADAFCELVFAVAEEQPVILIVDDLHLADDASIAVLHLMLRRLAGERVLLLCTARPAEISAGGNARRLLDRAGQIELAVLPIPPLTPDESEELLDGLLGGGGRPSPAARRAILQASAGFPMVLELLFDDWTAHGERCLALALGGMTEDAQAEGRPGEVYRQILERLTATLDPATHQALNLAAILGSRLNDFELYQLADLSLAQTLAGLTRLTALRILRDAGQGMEFINELMRAEAYLAVPSSIRRVLHSRVADVLIPRAGAGERALGLEIAWHCVRAGRREEFSRYLITGTDEAIEQGAHVNAERALITALPTLTGEVKDNAEYRLAQILQDQGRWTESLNVLTPLTEAALSGIDPADVRDLVSVADAMIASMGATPTRPASDRLLAMIRDHRSVPMAIRAAAAIASSIINTQDTELAEIAMPLIDRLAALDLSDFQAAAVSVTRAHLMWPERRFDEVLHLLGDAKAIVAQAAPQSPLAVRINLGLGSTIAGTGRFSDAEPHLDKALAGARHIGNDILARNALAGLAHCSQRTGDYEQSLDRSRRALRLLPDEVNPGHTFACIYYEAFANAMLRREREALKAIEYGTTVAGRFVGTWVDQAWSLYAADLYLLIGEDREARRLARAGIFAQGGSLLNIGLAGAYCRWCVVLGPDLPHSPAIRQTFRTQVEQIGFRDAVDRAEIALAAESPFGQGITGGVDLCAVKAAVPAHLPSTTMEQVRRLGLKNINNAS